jgi:hypothetical protein
MVYWSFQGQQAVILFFCSRLWKTGSVEDLFFQKPIFFWCSRSYPEDWITFFWQSTASVSRRSDTLARCSLWLASQSVSSLQFPLEWSALAITMPMPYAQQKSAEHCFGKICISFFWMWQFSWFRSRYGFEDPYVQEKDCTRQYNQFLFTSS